MENLAELGVGAIIALMILQSVFNFLKTKKAGECNSRSATELREKVTGLEATTKKIWDIHNRYDDNGSPLWYVPRSWAETQREIVEVCREIANTQKAIAETLSRMEQRRTD